MSFTIKQPKKKDVQPGLLLVFIDRVLFLNNSLDNLVKNLKENDFYHLSQELNANVLGFVKKKGFFPYVHWGSFAKFDEGLPSKVTFYSS